ncbi:MAG: glycoside hydrolase [bacterium]|nr:glycoside hydrolase [bacterium]
MTPQQQSPGKIVLELPPTSGNPRNSEGAFITLRDNRILFIYSHFTGTSSADHASCSLARCYSTDSGETWSKPEIFLTADEEKAMNIMSVSLLRMQNGDIGLFYLIRKGWNDMRLYLRRSSDEGLTWSNPICCIPSSGYFVVNNDRVIRLHSGRLIIPANLFRMKYTPATSWQSLDHRGIAIFFISDDDGKTWYESDNYQVLTDGPTQSGLQETGIIELQDGTLWAWARTDLGRQYQMFSYNHGLTWTKPVPSMFWSPLSPLSMKREPNSGIIIAVWNPYPIVHTGNWPGRTPVRGTDRNPLVLSFSKDDGKTWSDYFILEQEEKSGYCYTAMHFTADSLLLAYCAGNIDQDRGILNRLRIRKIPFKELFTPPQ